MAGKGFNIRDLATKKRVLLNVPPLCKGMWGNVTEICRLFSVNKKWGGGFNFRVCSNLTEVPPILIMQNIVNLYHFYFKTLP